MKIEHLLIIPDKDNIETYIAMARKYGLGFEFNDFFLPSLLDNEKMLKDTMRIYTKEPGMPTYLTSHGAFFDVVVFSDDPRIFEVSDFRVEQSLTIAEQLGAKGVIFHTNYTPNFLLDSYRTGWVEKNARYWSDKLDKYKNIDIYIENMFDTDWELLARLGERMKGREHFGLCFDYAHAQVFGDEKEIDAWVMALSPYVRHIHVNDNDFNRDLHLAVGDGKIDWVKFRNYYEQYFRDASVLIEVKGIENIQRSLDYFEKL